MPTNGDDERAGRLLREIRRRAGQTQRQLSTMASVPRRDVIRIEAGDAGQVSLDRIRRTFDAAGARTRLTVWWGGAAADRLLDERHAALVERAAELLRRRGWETVVEATFSEYGERGSIDLLGARSKDRAIALCEIKSDLGSLEETNRVLDAKEAHSQDRLGPIRMAAGDHWPDPDLAQHRLDATNRGPAPAHDGQCLSGALE